MSPPELGGPFRVFILLHWLKKWRTVYCTDRGIEELGERRGAEVTLGWPAAQRQAFRYPSSMSRSTGWPPGWPADGADGEL